jgi:molecular chaperone DnaJ
LIDRIRVAILFPDGVKARGARRTIGSGMPHDLYQVLGVRTDATAIQIRAAYRQRALELHPDRAGGASDLFRELQDAYDILSDPARRRQYDQDRNRSSSRPIRPRPQPPRKPRNWRPGPEEFTGQNDVIDFAVTSREAAQGGSVELVVPLECICPACSGVGANVGNTCSFCRGFGRVAAEQPVMVGFPPGIRGHHTVHLHLGMGTRLTVRFFVEAARW